MKKTDNAVNIITAMTFRGIGNAWIANNLSDISKEEEIVIKLIELCNDTYEIKEHKRNTKLIFEKESFKYPNDIKDHDALIVFSRKNVLAVASDLESKGIKTSTKMVRELMRDMGLVSIRQVSKSLYTDETRKHNNYLNQ